MDSAGAAADGLPARVRRQNVRADQRHLLRLEARVVLGWVVESRRGLWDRVVGRQGRAVLWVAALAACGDSPFQPRGMGERVPIGQVIEDQLADSIERRYSFEAAPDGEYVVYLKSLEGFVVLTVEDSIRLRGLCAVAVSSSPGPTLLEENPTPNCVTPIGGVQLIEVRSLAGRTARYEFKVYAVNRRPESVDSSFALGDTVTGESIEPLVDADIFSAHGDSGQTIAVIVEPLG